MSLLTDTSILVRLKDKKSPQQSMCQAALAHLRMAETPVYLCTQSLIEYWNVSTRPLALNGLGRTTKQAYRDCLRFCRLFRLLSEPADITDRWLELVNRYEVKGKQVHDARMAAFAWSYGIPRILTLNPSDFERYTELTALTPKEVV
jgi:predicted nucleic acid-binding protein